MREVFIVDGRRSPQAKAGMDLKDVPVPYLCTNLIQKILEETQIPATDIDEVIVGNVGAPAKYPNIGRVIALEAGLPKEISGYTVHRNCASGMEAVSEAYLKIASGRSELIFAGGVESMSQMPLIFSKEMTDIFVELMKAKAVPEKLSAFKKFRFPYLSPVIAIEQGLTDPFCGLNMGMTAEILAREFNISRLEQDTFANSSHLKASEATKLSKFKDEIVPVYVGKKVDKILDTDVGPRENSTIEGLGKMKPYFDKKSGTVTVANSCPITDGGSMLLFASGEAVKKYNLKPIAKMIDYHFAGLEPERMGMGPLRAIHGVLKRTKLTVKDMDLFEINEAFAAQVLAVKKGFSDINVAKRFGIDEVMGEISDDKLNVNGGGIALGHPVGSTGSRLIVTLMHELKRRKKENNKIKYGVASLCIGGGQGGAVIVEAL